jgi:hypothetical protein
MNTHKRAEAALAEFMDSSEKVVLLTGTNEHRKHVLALQTLVNQAGESTILFRANFMQNIGSFYGDFETKFKAGKAYRIQNHTLFFDTMKDTYWDKSPLQADHAVMYPLENFFKCNERQRRLILDDLMRRVSGKIFLVNIDDDTNNAWLSDIAERHVVYDVEEDEPKFDQTKKEFIFEEII